MGVIDRHNPCAARDFGIGRKRKRYRKVCVSLKKYLVSACVSRCSFNVRIHGCFRENAEVVTDDNAASRP